MKKNGFVYIWINLTNNKKYIGYHQGRNNDGYISSSHSKLFWDDFNNKNMQWERKIIFTGETKQCLIEEQKLLRNVDIKSDEYYNNARGSEIIFTDDVRKKMSTSAQKRWKNTSENDRIKRNKKISLSKKGVKRNIETIEKMVERYKSDEYYGIIKKELYDEVKKKIIKSNTGKKRTDEFKQKQREKFLGEKNPMYGRKHSKEFVEERRKHWTENNPNKNGLSEEHKKKVSESKMGTPSPFKGVPRKKVKCPYCDKVGGEGLMHRWHFDNCKKK